MTVLTTPRPQGRRRAGDEQHELQPWPAAPEAPAPPSPPGRVARAATPAPETGSDPQDTVAVPDGPTLEALVSGVWEGLSAHAPVACPVCAAEMHPRYGAGTAAVGGRCGGCGSELS